MNIDTVKLEKVKLEDKKVLENIYQLYLHDMSEYNGEDIDSRGLYDVDFLSLFFKEEGLMAFFIKVEDKIHGLILLQSGKYAPSTGEDYYIGEFFILKKYRRHGIGKTALKELLYLYPGKYMVGQLPNNMPAISFWKSVFSQLGIQYKESAKDFTTYKLICQSFEAGRLL